MKIVIVGGVAGGASAAAKARRVSEKAEIVMFERGPYVSFGNCGLPYYVGGTIEERADLLLQTPETFWRRFRVRAMVRHEVLKIDRAAKTVSVKNLTNGTIFDEAYDQLILAPGAGAIVPPLDGVRLPNVFTVKTVPDSDAIRTFMATHQCRRAVVVGAGFIGLEAAEALKQKGLDVTVIEMLPQVLPPFDADMARFVSDRLRESGIELILGDGIKAFHGDALAGSVELASGRRIELDLVILSVGVRPELKLAAEAGLTIGEAGGIVVDDHQRTSDPNILAAGDAAEVEQLVTHRRLRIPLAGPANKQGRVAGANAAGEPLTFPGAVGTAIVECMGIVAAKTGLSEKEARAAGINYSVSFTHSADHAGYYPGAQMIHMKVIYESTTGRLLGAQIVGEAGVDKRIDVVATALSASLKVTDLENLDLAYAPQFSSAKDPIVIAGFVAANALRGDVRTVTCEELRKRVNGGNHFQLVDVRTPAEYASGHLPGALSIPIDDLRERLKELDPKKETAVYCRGGLRAYLGARILSQSGFENVSNLSGGYLMCGAAGPVTEDVRGMTVQKLKELLDSGQGLTIDVRDEDEYRYDRIAGTKNVPLDRLATVAETVPRDQEIYLLCQTGARSEEAMTELRSAGFVALRSVSGGLSAWKRAGFPTERSRGPIPMMRQVQIVAGSLALIGGLFSSLRVVSIIVGAGLIFAGASGTCGMAVVLGRMPWNRRNARSGSGCDSGCRPGPG